MALLMLLERLRRADGAGDPREHADLAGRAIPGRVVEAMQDAALQHLRNERMQAQGRRHEVAHARVLGSGCGCQLR